MVIGLTVVLLLNGLMGIKKEDPRKGKNFYQSLGTHQGTRIVRRRKKRDRKIVFDHLIGRSVHKIFKKFPQDHIIKMLKFGQKEVTTKDFYGQRQITDIFMIDVKKVVFDKVPCDNGKHCRYIVGYQVD